MIRVIIIEDEHSPRQLLKEKLERHFPEIEIVAICENAEAALKSILQLSPDLLFLDIELPGKNGLWLADELMQMKNENFTSPDVIFTTSYTYSEYLLKAFELAAIDYLVKPVILDNLEKAIDRYLHRTGITSGLQNLVDAINKEKLLKFKSFNGLLLLRPDDIAYVEADRNYACMFLANGAKETVFEKLSDIEKKLPAETFLRAGKSIIVNRKYTHKITDTTLQLITSSTRFLVQISRKAAREMKEKIA